MDNQRRLSQEQLQHAQQNRRRDLVRGLAHEIKNCWRPARRGAATQQGAARPGANVEYTKSHHSGRQATQPCHRLLGPQHPNAHYREHT